MRCERAAQSVRSESHAQDGRHAQRPRTAARTTQNGWHAQRGRGGAHGAGLA